MDTLDRSYLLELYGLSTLVLEPLYNDHHRPFFVFGDRQGGTRLLQAPFLKRDLMRRMAMCRQTVCVSMETFSPTSQTQVCECRERMAVADSQRKPRPLSREGSKASSEVDGLPSGVNGNEVPTVPDRLKGSHL